MKKLITVLLAAVALAGTAAEYSVAANTVYTNSPSPLAVGTTIVVPDGAAFDLHTTSNSGWYNSRYSFSIAGTGPDGKGVLRDTGTCDPKADDPQIISITLTGDALIKSDHYMALLERSYAATYINLNNHTLTIDMADSKKLAMFTCGPWSAKGTIKVVNGVLGVPCSYNGTKKTYGFTDFENATLEVTGAKSELNISDVNAGIFLQNLFMGDGAKLTGNGYFSVKSGTYRPSEKASSFTGTFKVWNNISLDLTQLDGTWNSPTFGFYNTSSATITITPGEWATADTTKAVKIIAWTAPPANLTFTLASAYQTNWRLVTCADGAYLAPSDYPFYAVMADAAGSAWTFYTADWTDVTSTCGLSSPNSNQTVAFTSVAEYETLKTLNLTVRGYMLRSCKFTADAILTGLPYAIEKNATIDVNGHAFTVPKTPYDPLVSVIPFTVKSSAAGGVVTIDVASGEKRTLTAITLSGGTNLVLWKTGGGRLAMEKNGQAIGAGDKVACVVKEGVLAKKANVKETNFGAANSYVRVENGAQADIMGWGNWDCSYQLAGDGPDGKGALVCGVANANPYLGTKSHAHLRHLMLNADASLGGDYDWALNFYNNEVYSTLYLNGHTLTVGTGTGFIYWVGLKTAGEGKIVVKKAEVYLWSPDLSNVDVTVKEELSSDGTNYFAKVKSLVFEEGAVFKRRAGTEGTVATTVFDRYRPGTGIMPSVTLGATNHLTPALDLSTHPDVLDGTNLAFCAGAQVSVDTGTRVIHTHDCLVAWAMRPADVSFRLTGKYANFQLEKRSDGLYVNSGMIIYLR